MRGFIVLAILLFGFPALANAHEFLIIKPSPHSVAKTIDRLAAVMKKKGVTMFARIDHAAGAERVGAKLRPTQLLIFGNPKIGTPMMQSNQKIGLALPLKALAWEDENGKVWLGYTKPSVVAKRYKITDRAAVVKKMTGAMNKLTDAALKP